MSSYGTLMRAPTQALYSAIGSTGTICAVQTYISARTGQQVTANDIVGKFIQLLQSKGFTGLTPLSIDALLKLTEDPNINRLIQFKELLTWIDPAIRQHYNLNMVIPKGKQLKLFDANGQPMDATQLRSALNHSGIGLKKSTVLSHAYTGQPGDDFCSEWETTPCNYVEESVPDEELEHIFNITRQSNLAGHKKFKEAFPQMSIDQVDANLLRAVRRKKCARCWICNEYIYLYKVPNQTGAVVNCGQEEHRFPPGIGNLIGTLMAGTGGETQAALLDNELLREGLAPSHAWCNQIKSDISIIQIQQYLYGVNDNGMNIYLADVEKAYNSNVHNDSFELMFKKGDPQKLKFLQQAIRNTMTTYLVGLVKRLNTPSSGEGHSLSNMIILRTAFFGVQQCLATIAKVEPRAYNEYFLPQWQGTPLITQIGGNRSYKQKGGNDPIQQIEQHMTMLAQQIHTCDADPHVMHYMGVMDGDSITTHGGAIRKTRIHRKKKSKRAMRSKKNRLNRK